MLINIDSEVDGAVKKVIRADVITTEIGDDECRNNCVANPECLSFNLAKLSETEFYCELTKYLYTDTDMVKEAQTDEGKDNWSFSVSIYLLKIWKTSRDLVQLNHCDGVLNNY